MLWISALSVFLIAAALSAMLFFSFSGHDNGRTVLLPEISHAAEVAASNEPDALNHVEVTTDTLQAVVATLSRPDIYSRSVVVEMFWGGGHAVFNIDVSVIGNMTALKVSPSVGIEKRIIVTSDTLYIWYSGDRTSYTRSLDDSGAAYKDADEWQMLVSYEDLLRIDSSDILEAGYMEYGGEYCVYGDCRTPEFGYVRRYYIPTSLGLVTGVEEYDEKGSIVYSMTAGHCVVGEVDTSAFFLPDGTNVLEQAIG